jgi:hypothetical protein
MAYNMALGDICCTNNIGPKIDGQVFWQESDKRGRLLHYGTKKDLAGHIKRLYSGKSFDSYAKKSFF